MLIDMFQKGRSEMNQAKRRRLEARGWKVGSAADFLRLTPEEAAFVEVKSALVMALRLARADSAA